MSQDIISNSYILGNDHLYSIQPQDTWNNLSTTAAMMEAQGTHGNNIADVCAHHSHQHNRKRGNLLKLSLPKKKKKIALFAG